MTRFPSRGGGAPPINPGYYEAPHDREENLNEDVPWYLGPRPDDHAVRAGGYQPEHTNEPTAAKVRRAVDGLGDLMDDYEFHYPGELNPDNLDEVRDALDGHGIATVCTGLHTRLALRARAASPRPTRRRAPRRAG